MNLRRISSFVMFLLMTLTCSWASDYDYKLSVAAIFRDEAPYLREWIEYHKLVGVEHFYLYNNLSKDNYSKVLAPYISKGEVDLIEWPYEAGNLSEWDQIQVAAYNDALELAQRSKWLAIIDTDEFLVPVVDKTIVKMLSHYETKKIGGVCLPWVFFGTSHVKKLSTNQLMIENLVLNGGMAAGGDQSAIWNQGAYKSIVRPKYVSITYSPHYCDYVSGKHHTMIWYETAQINHYWSRDEYFLNQIKIPRRQKWDQDAQSVLSWEVGMNNSNNLGQPILRFVPALKKRMGL